MKKVVIIDTSVMCVWLKVPGKSNAGPAQDRWTHASADKKIRTEEKAGTGIILPLAVLIETGNHICHSPGDRFTLSRAFAKIILKAADRDSPWTAFTRQRDLWEPEGLKRLANEWPEKVKSGISMGDATIIQVMERYKELGYEIDLMSDDRQLNAHQPSIPPRVPPRRRK